jgi:hypothetical protein
MNNMDDLQRNTFHANGEHKQKKRRDKLTISGASVKRRKWYPRVIGDRLQDGVQHSPDTDGTRVYKL